jgi:hypothetical protein
MRCPKKRQARKRSTRTPRSTQPALSIIICRRSISPARRYPSKQKAAFHQEHGQISIVIVEFTQEFDPFI